MEENEADKQDDTRRCEKEKENMLSLSQPSGFALSEDLLFIFCP
jgi:hypothetical protein